MVRAVGRRVAAVEERPVGRPERVAWPALDITGESGGDPRSYRVAFDKALTSLPGFTPRWTLEAGVEEVARWLRDGGLKGEAFDGPRFVRLAQLKRLKDEGVIDGDLRRVRPG